MKIGKSAGKDFAYICGVYLGDGCLSDYLQDGRWPVTYFRLNTIDADFAAAVKAALLALGAKSVRLSAHAVKKSSKPNHALGARHDALCAALKAETGAKQHLPRGWRDWSRRDRLALVAGIMDSEGFVAANGSNPTNRRFYMGYKSCDVWVPEFLRLLDGLGIRYGKVQTEKPRKPGYKAPTRFTIKMQSWIDAGGYFNIARKQERVEAWAAIGAYEGRAKAQRRSTSETNTPDREAA